MEDPKCDVCEFEIIQGDVNDYAYISDGNYYEFHGDKVYLDVFDEDESYDIHICPECTPDPILDVALPEDTPKDERRKWMINYIKEQI